MLGIYDIGNTAVFTFSLFPSLDGTDTTVDYSVPFTLGTVTDS